MKTKQIATLCAIGLLAATSPGQSSSDAAEDEAVIELERFIVEETALQPQASLSPLAVSVDHLFGSAFAANEIPRSATAISPETMASLGLENLDDLSRYGAGTQRINFFGLAGSPVLRGSRAGLYFNGMIRLFQRNEFPTSFGSVEGMELVKGPAPGHLDPTLVGGFINLQPKSPYFDRARGAVELQAGAWNFWRGQLDYGAPFLWGEHPAAYRVSLTGQRADRYYQHVRDDFDSIYGALKLKLTDSIRLFTGGEFYDFRSAEVPGINRPTQALIDTHQYIIGEPADLTSPAWGGTVARPLVEFPGSLGVNPALHALAIPGEVARARIPEAQRAQMLDLNDPAVVAALYTVDPSAPPGWQALAAEALASFTPRTQDAYVYTPEYFAAGGEVLTAPIGGDQILASPDDFAEATNYLWFLNLEDSSQADFGWRNDFYLEGMDTARRATYGFAAEVYQLALANRTTLSWRLDAADTELHSGIALRMTRSRIKQDFDAEPFSRRDLSRSTISANSIVYAGGQLDPDGQNLWSTFGGASEASELYQAAWFITGNSALLPRTRFFYSLRLENAWWEVGLPAGIDGVSPAQAAARRSAGYELNYSVSLNPVVELSDHLNAYAAVQLGQALAPGDGGTISGPDSFTDVELYEAGLKGVWLDGALFMSLAAYHWDQAVFSNRDNEARPLRGQGVEFEATYAPETGLALIGAFTAQRIHLKNDVLGFGAALLSPEEWALQGGILNGEGGRRASEANNPENIAAGFPELSASLHAQYQWEWGGGLSGGPVWRSRFYHDAERALSIPASVVWRASVFYLQEPWELRLTVENVFDEDYWLGAEPVFAAGTLITPAEPRAWRLSAKYRF